jgi:hypothetical protein
MQHVYPRMINLERSGNPFVYHPSRQTLELGCRIIP